MATSLNWRRDYGGIGRPLDLLKAPLYPVDLIRLVCLPDNRGYADDQGEQSGDKHQTISAAASRCQIGKVLPKHLLKIITV